MRPLTCMTDPSLIDIVVIVMMENRSFDHMLGYLRHPRYGKRKDVNGLRSTRSDEYANPFESEAYYPFRIRKDLPLPCDLPHERKEIATQLAFSPVTGGPTMTGFVEAYYEATQVNRTRQPEPMGFFTAAEVPITDFLARNFAVCDRWFAPLPASTHPNRLMAFSGYTRRDTTEVAFLPDQDLVFDWLDRKRIRWRVYSAGLSFFALMPRLWDEILGPRFRSFPRFVDDMRSEPLGEFPQVIFIEPDYEDSPVHLSGHGNCNHAPLSIGYGEEFFRRVYQALTLSPEKWARTLAIFTYDEHGGFFDHEPPIRVRTDPSHGEDYLPFETTGVRVPTIVASPLVRPGTLYSGNLDHTSILQFLAERFAADESGYSPEVNARRAEGIRNVSEVLNLDSPRTDLPPVPLAPIPVRSALTAVRLSTSPNQEAFEKAAASLVEERHDEVVERYPSLVEWRALCRTS